MESINLYNKLIKENKYKSSEILFLVSNNTTRMNVLNDIDFDFSEEIKITTYISFVKNELKKYWSLISNKNISPIFVNSTFVEYFLNEKVKKLRIENNFFRSLTSSDKSIVKSIINNIKYGIESNIDFKEISYKIYDLKKDKERFDKILFDEMNFVITDFFNSFLENEILDDNLCIYVYNKFLLNNDIYIEQLEKRYKYLIVDNLSINLEVDFIEYMSKFCEKVYYFFDRTKDYSSFKNVDIDYIKENLFSNENIEIIKISDFEIELEHIYLLNKEIELDENSIFYDEMIENALNKIKGLLNEGYKKEDIVVITPINNNLIENSISNKLKSINSSKVDNVKDDLLEVDNTKNDLLENKEELNAYNNLMLKSTKNNNKLVEYSYGNSLYVALCIFNDLEYLVTFDEYVNFIQTIFEVNKIRAIKIFKSEEFKELINKIKNYQEEISIEDYESIKLFKSNKKTSDFLNKFYIDNMLKLKNGKENIKLCKKLIEESEVFFENINSLFNNLNKNDVVDENDLKIEKNTLNLSDSYSKNIKENTKEKTINLMFVDLIKNFINDYYGYFDIKEMEKDILITTPINYLSNNLKRKIHIWLDVSSETYSFKIEKEISNQIVLRKTFNRIYDENVEAYYRNYYLKNVMYNLMKTCDKVYAFKNEYSINGYTQESYFYELINKLEGKSYDKI